MNNTQTTVRRRSAGSRGGRLDQTSWIKAAMDQLAIEGIDGVRVEVLARHLGVTKGSFYAHFKDREELHEAILGYWRSRATLALIDRMNQIGTSARKRLERLIKVVIETKSRWGDDAELSIRLWARRDNRARETLSEVDQMRTLYIANLLVEAGLGVDQARARALLVYSYMRVAPSLGTVVGDRDMGLAQDILLAGTRD